MTSTIRQCYLTTLQQPGDIVKQLYYGSLASYWWSLKNDNGNNIAIPIRKNMCTSTKVKDAIIKVIVTADEINHPKFTAWCGDASFKANTVSVAVNSAYQNHLNLIGQSSNTRLNGLPFLGITHLDIEKKLLTNVDQIPQISEICNLIDNKLTVWIITLKRNEENDCNKFCSSFIGNWNTRVKAIFYQTVKDQIWTVQTFDMKSNILLKEYSDSSASNVWQQINKYSTFSGETLFGIEDSKVKEIIYSKEKPTCSIQNLSNPEVFDNMFDAYLNNHIGKKYLLKFCSRINKYRIVNY